MSSQDTLRTLAALVGAGAAAFLVFTDPARVAVLGAICLVVLALAIRATARRAERPRSQRG